MENKHPPPTIQPTNEPTNQQTNQGQNSSFEPKQNTKVTFNHPPPTHHQKLLR